MSPPTKPPERRPRRGGARVRRPPEESDGKGRDTILTPRRIEEIGEAVEDMLSFKEACKHLGISQGAFYEWKAKGREDKAAKRATIYAQLVDRLSRAITTRKRECGAAIRRGVNAAAPGSRLKGGRAALAVKAGDLALKVLTQTTSGKKGAEKRWGQAPGEATPEAPRLQVDLSRLNQQELGEYVDLSKEAREAFATMSLERVARLQHLTAKALAPSAPHSEGTQ